MAWYSDIVFRLRALVRRPREERELAEEMAFHLDMATRTLVDEGWPPAAAAAEARRRFGQVAREERRARDSWGIAWLVDFGADLRAAWRQLARRPAFTALGVGTLALGLGATVSLWGVVHGLLIAPLPVRDDARLQVFWSDLDWRGVEFDYVKERQRPFSGLAAFSFEGYTLRVAGQSSTLLTTVASAELFDVIGAAPLMGRTFQTGDDRPGAAPVIVVSHGFWQQELGGDPQVIGRRLEIDGAPVEVVGVMPRGFYFPTPQMRAWRPLLLDPASGAYQGNGWLTLVGREKPGLSRGELEAGVQAIAASLGERFTYPAAWDKTKNAKVTPLRDYVMGPVRPALLLLQAAVVLVLLVACANVAALVLARTTDRAGELALRTALGAGRGRLVRQILAESLAMSITASVIGTAVALAGTRALATRLPLSDGLADALGVDWSALGVALALAIVTAALVAVAPIRALWWKNAPGLSRERTSGGLASGPRRAHAGLVAAEVALALWLVAGAAMLARTVQGLYAIDTGFDAANVTAIDVVPPTAVMPAEVRHAFFADAATRVAAMPGVAAAGLITRLPLRDGGWQGTLQIEDRPDLRDGREPNTFYRIVTPGLFTALGIDITAGRGFTAADARGTLPVGIVSARFARTMWPDRDPIGRRVRSTFSREPVWITVVGVAEETRMTRLTGDNPLVLYVPQAQADATEGAVLVVKGAGAAAPVAAIRAAIQALDGRVAIGRVTTLDDVVTASLAEPLRLRFFFATFGVLALLIGAVGIYGVVSYAVTRRRAEFGVRLALGAAPGRIVGEVLGGGLAPVAIGVVAGIAGALGLGRLIARFLFGVTPTDPWSLGTAAAVLLLAGLLAALLPGVRAGRTDPVAALRAE